MILFKQAAALQSYLNDQRGKGATIGFVPTMGALHHGHLSLIQQAKAETDIAVCSIFVNPTQFNNPDDFTHYPVTTEKDIALLTEQGCDVLFLPSRDEIYPANFTAEHYDLGELETVLEGRFRPGHYQGVCQVMDRLLGIVEPNKLYMGEKDYQQCMVVKKLLLLKNWQAIDMIIAPTVREADGLAMSSRNQRLNKQQRAIAPAIYEELSAAKKSYPQQSVDHIKTAAINHLTAKGFHVDYFEIADAASLHPLSDTSATAVALVAASLDNIRLIDNLPLN